MAHASESGLSRLFDNLLARDGGFREQVEDVDFYEEGGVGGRIQHAAHRLHVRTVIQHVFGGLP